jgi:hypothetical protein
MPPAARREFTMKTVALFALQAAVALITLAMGCAMMAGAAPMVQPLAAVGLTNAVLATIGAAEIAAGLLLLWPRTGALGATLLSAVIVLTAGASFDAAIRSRDDAHTLTRGSRVAVEIRPDVPDAIKPARNRDI